ncbi:TonB-dependent siderophore receptor [Myxacorys almedinensis]|nr:TonB-dependent siderophore receptor [Myxacorys almedinensis]
MAALTGSLVSGLAVPGRAEERSPLTPLKKVGTEQRLEVPLLKGDLGGSRLADQATVSHFRDRPRPATTVKEWMAQIEAATVQVTSVSLNRTDTGLEIVLQTAEGKPLQVDATKFRTEGSSLIADIPNAVLALPNAPGFSAANPTPDIATLGVTQQDANTIRVSVAGTGKLPTSEVTLKVGELAYSLNPEVDEPDEEIVVTGQQNGYRVPNATTATKTDTPLRDIPASIQVIPRRILEDQKTTRVQEALENVSGVRKRDNFGGSNAGGYNIRGFDQAGNFRNGFSDNDSYSSVDTANIDRIEVLKGPASVLFGQAEPGGIVNIVTKQPLSTPYYSAEFNVGNYAFYRPSFDISGPLTDDGSVLYRLNVAYQNSESFRDFNFTERVFVAPVITWNISDRTSLTFDLEYLNNDYLYDRGLPSIGDRPAPIPISRFIGLPESVYNDSNLRVGYRLEHEFSQDWQLRNAFSFVSGRLTGDSASGGRALVDNQFAPIFIDRQEFTRKIYTLQTELVGKFKTGSIVHQPLIGVELRRNTWEYTGFGAADSILLDIFNPNYDVDLPAISDEAYFYTTRRDTLGIYLQDQITFADNLKVLVGGRFDTFQRKQTELGETTGEESLSAFNPRVGIVYQPIQPISLYASYTQSFQPDRFFGRSATNEPFKPTRGTQYEVGIKADISEKLSATLAAYQITKTNVVTADPNDPDLSVQVGEQRSRGIELDIGGEILPGLNIIASYTYTDAITSKDNRVVVGNRINNVPEHAASLWTTYELQSGDLKGLGFGLGLYYVGDRYADLENTSIMPSYFRTDFAIYYKRDNWRLGLNIRNLFNETYYETSQSRNIIYPGAPFTVIGSFSIQF